MQGRGGARRPLRLAKESWAKKKFYCGKGTGPPPTENYQSAGQATVLYVNGLQQTTEALRSRGPVFEGNDDFEECPTFRDPDGHWFQLVEPGGNSSS